MTLLNDLTDDQRNMIVSLPYRVGLWISESDGSGGDEAAAQELEVLSNIIEGFADGVFASEVVQHIMSGTLWKKDEWHKWVADRDEILADCRVAIDVLNEHFDVKEVDAFKTRLIEIAEAIALAFREYEDAPLMDRVSLYLSYFSARFYAKISKTPYKTLDEYLSISRHERGALGDLAQALGV